MSRRWWIRGAIAAAVLAVAGFWLVPRLTYSMSHESTDDAFVDGPVTAVSAQVGGRVVRVLVHENQAVKAGDSLVEIDPRDYRTAVGQGRAGLAEARAARGESEAAVAEAERAVEAARADLESARSDSTLAAKDADRSRALLDAGAISTAENDRATAAAEAAAAAVSASRAALERARASLASQRAGIRGAGSKVEGARLSLEQARADLERTVVTAPVDGVVAETNVHAGEVVSPGQPLMALVNAGEVWVTANFKETQIRDMRIGQPVDIEVDAYPGVTFRGHVESFQPGTGAVFSLLPPQNATGNFIKVVQRVPVRIAFDRLDPRRPLWPGLSAEPHVDTGSH